MDEEEPDPKFAKLANNERTDEVPIPLGEIVLSHNQANRGGTN
jgi:hypothetical protein